MTYIKIDTQYKNYLECCNKDKESDNCRWACYNRKVATREAHFTDYFLPVSFGVFTLGVAAW